MSSRCFIGSSSFVLVLEKALPFQVIFSLKCISALLGGIASLVENHIVFIFFQAIDAILK